MLTFVKPNWLTPLRAFEQWLLEDEPAVGVADLHNNAKGFLKRKRLICGVNESTLVVPVVWFDALFNAFHHKAIRHILSFPTQYDKEIWWIPQLHVIPRPGAKVCTYHCLQPKTSFLSSGGGGRGGRQVVFRANTCHYYSTNCNTVQIWS